MSSADTVAKVVIDAFDVDVQIFAARLLRDLTQTGFGAQFATWAQTNPGAFDVMLRAFSAAVQAGPRNRSLLAEAVRDQAARLPVELRRAILGEEPTGPSTSSSGYPLSDPDFTRRYEEALQGLSEEQLRAVARLSQTRLKEWVYSPAAIRPIKLDEWGHEKTIGDQFAQFLSKAGPKWEELDANAAVMAEKLREWRLSQKWLKRSPARQRELEAQVARSAGVEHQRQPADAKASDTSVKLLIGLLIVMLAVIFVLLLLLLQ